MTWERKGRKKCVIEWRGVNTSGGWEDKGGVRGMGWGLW